MRRRLTKTWVDTVGNENLQKKPVRATDRLQVTGLGQTQLVCGRMSGTQSKLLEKASEFGVNSHYLLQQLPKSKAYILQGCEP